MENAHRLKLSTEVVTLISSFQVFPFYHYQVASSTTSILLLQPFPGSCHSLTKRRVRLGMGRADAGGGGRHVCARAPAPAPEGHRGKQSRGLPCRPVPLRLGQTAGERCSPSRCTSRIGTRHIKAIKSKCSAGCFGGMRVCLLPVASELSTRLVEAAAALHQKLRLLPQQHANQTVWDRLPPDLCSHGDRQTCKSHQGY